MKLKLILICLFAPMVQAQSPVPTAAIPARSAEVLASYARTTRLQSSIAQIEPGVARFCSLLLASQHRLLRTTDSWKMYSLYEAFEQAGLMTSALVRVPTVTELSGSIPRYTGYHVTQTVANSRELLLMSLPNGAILISDRGSRCGPDPLAVTKGSYFVKCGTELIGSGLMALRDYTSADCRNVRVLVNSSLR